MAGAPFRIPAGRGTGKGFWLTAPAVHKARGGDSAGLSDPL